MRRELDPRPEGRVAGRAFGGVAVVIVMLLVAAAPAVAEPWRWGAAGDSLTHRDPFTYPNLLVDANRKLHNVAQGGCRIWDFIDDQVPRLLRQGCTLVTVSIGTNDVIQPTLSPSAPVVTPDEYAFLMDWAVTALQLADPRRCLILGTVPPAAMYPACRTWTDKQRAWARTTIVSYNQALADIAVRRDCILWTLPTLPSRMFQADGFHPDAAGNRLMARTLRPLLPQGPAPSPRPWPLDAGRVTYLPESGPPGTVVSIRGKGLEDVKRVVYFTGASDHDFVMCPVVSWSEDSLAVAIPPRATGNLELWLMKRIAVNRHTPSVRLGMFRVAAPSAGPPAKAAAAGGVWLGVLTGAGGRETAIRVDMDQAGPALKGRALLIEAGHVRRAAVHGTVKGRAVDCRTEDGWHLSGRVSDDGRLIRVSPPWSGALRRF